jgi:hypothetical protein
MIDRPFAEVRRTRGGRQTSLCYDTATLHREVYLMAIPAQVKPAIWGAVGGAIAAMIIGFVWGGWVTGGTSEKAATVAANTEVVQAFVPVCVAKAEQQPDQIIALKKESSSYQRSEMVFKADGLTASQKNIGAM